MRTQFSKSVKGVATMKCLVAGLLVLTFVSSIIVQGQSPSRSANRPANKPRSDTIKICQGVPLPDGYIVVAYMTSAACPHGAYLLKKQNNYENSLAVNGDSRGTTDQTSSRKTSSPAGKPNSPSTGTSAGRDQSTSTPATGASSSQ